MMTANNHSCSVFDLPKKAVGGQALKVTRGRSLGRKCSLLTGVGGYAPYPIKFLIFFHFKIVHSGAFSQTNSKVLFAIKCRERYVTTEFLVTDGDTDMKTSSFHQSPVNLSPSSHSIATRVGFTATVGMCYRPEIILHSRPGSRSV